MDSLRVMCLLRHRHSRNNPVRGSGGQNIGRGEWNAVDGCGGRGVERGVERGGRCGGLKREGRRREVGRRRKNA